MIVTLATTMPSATDLGYLVHKHPDKTQSFDIAGGTAHVVWPAASAERAEVALVLDVDPIALVRGAGRGAGKGGQTASGPLAQYVNDRPYAATSMLASALGKVFRTAMTGRCEARPELAATPIPLVVHLPALPSRGGAGLVERLFAPLGWSVQATPIPLDTEVPAWGDSPYVDATLTATIRLADALTQLYVLLPVLDDAKHYWVASFEVEKLLRAGGDWLAAHPDRDLITRRYLKHQRDLVSSATDAYAARLAEVDDAPADDVIDDAATREAAARPDAPAVVSLARTRREAVLAALRTEGAASVVDLGCGEGALLRELLADPAFTSVLGVDVSHRALEVAAKRLDVDRLPGAVRARLQLVQSSATYRDDRLAGHDAVVMMEVIEHVDSPRLPALERSVFVHARPTSVLVTTPNAEYNVRYPQLAAGGMRHPDHRFEWTRDQLRAWAEAAASAHGYTVRYAPIGDDDPVVGPPTQMAIFRRAA